MKFCPRCGKPKTGNFCGGCGFAFDAVVVPSVPTTTVPPVAPVVPTAPTPVAVVNGLVATPAEWRVDPINASQERYWDGLAWTNNVRPVSQTPITVNVAQTPAVGLPVAESQLEAPEEPAAKQIIETSLVYGEGFDVKKNCPNCGEPHTAKATTCQLCDEDL